MSPTNGRAELIGFALSCLLGGAMACAFVLAIGWSAGA